MENSKRLMLLFFLFLLTSCGNPSTTKEEIKVSVEGDSSIKALENEILSEKEKEFVSKPITKCWVSFDDVNIAIIDSCEYLVTAKSLTHKGNCEFCAKRKK